MNTRSRQAGGLEAETDLDPLHRLYGEHGGSDSGVETTIPGDVATEADGNAAGYDLEHAPESVSLGSRICDRGTHPFGGLRVDTPNVGCIGESVEFRVPFSAHPGANRTDRHDMAADFDSELQEQASGDRSGRHAGRCLAGARALQDVPCITPTVLEQADEVGVSRSRKQDATQLFLVGVRLRLHRHGDLPVLVIPIGNHDRDRGADRLAEAHAGDDATCIALDLHATASAIPQLPAREIASHIVRCEREPGRNALDDDVHALAVRLSSGRESKMSVHDSPGRL